MATERDINSTIRSLLIDNEAFEYAHLIKFERPQLPSANNTFSTNANRFAILRMELETFLLMMALLMMLVRPMVLKYIELINF